MWRRFLCWLGIHDDAEVQYNPVELDEQFMGGLQAIRWMVCKHCGTTWAE